MKPFVGKQAGAGVVTVTGDDPKRFHAAMVEYNKEKDMTIPKITGQLSKTSPSKSPLKATPKPKRRRQYKVRRQGHGVRRGQQALGSGGQEVNRVHGVKRC